MSLLNRSAYAGVLKSLKYLSFKSMGNGALFGLKKLELLCKPKLHSIGFMDFFKLERGKVAFISC